MFSTEKPYSDKIYLKNRVSIMRKKEKKVLLRTLITGYITILLLCLILPCAKIDLPIFTKPAYIKGYSNHWIFFTIIAFLLHLLNYKKRGSNRLILLLMVCYVMSVYSIFSQSLNVVPSWGFFLYLSSLILLLAILTVCEIKTKEPAEAIKENTMKLNGTYLLAYNIDCRDETTYLYKSAIISLDGKNTIEFIAYLNGELEHIKIKVEDIEEIKHEKVEILKDFAKMIKSEEIADYSIASALIKSYGYRSISPELVENVETYFSVEPKELYLLAINYKKESIIKTIGFYTKENPEHLINAINSKTK